MYVLHVHLWQSTFVTNPDVLGLGKRKATRIANFRATMDALDATLVACANFGRGTFVEALLGSAPIVTNLKEQLHFDPTKDLL